MSAVPIEIDVAAVSAMKANHEPFLLLDCREQHEYDHVHIEGSVLIPMQEIPNRVAELADHRDAPIVVHCHHGGRSMQVTQWLREQGFPNTQNMAGGIDQWSVEIDPSLPRY